MVLLTLPDTHARTSFSKLQNKQKPDALPVKKEGFQVCVKILFSKVSKD